MTVPVNVVPLYLAVMVAVPTPFAVITPVFPTVATDVGGNGEMLKGFEPCGEIVPYGDTGAFADAIEVLMGDPVTYDKYAKNALYNLNNHFHLDIMIMRKNIREVLC